MTKFYKNNISEFTGGEYKKDDLLRFAETIIENSNNIFYEHDLDGNPVFISKQIEEILGYSPSESNIKWQQLLTENPDNKNAYLSKENAIATRKKQPTYEVEVYSKQGGKVWLEIREAPIIKEGKVVSIAGAAIDITERKSSEKLLLDSEEKFSKLFQTSPNIIVISEIETGRFIDINDLGAKKLGYDKNELIGKTSIEVGMIKLELRKENIDLLNSQGYFSSIEKTLIKKNGESFTGLFYGQKITLSNREYLFQTIVDITERKKIEQALKLSEEKFAKAFDNNPNAITISSLEDSTIIDINDFGCKELGYSKNEIIGKTALELGILTSEDRSILINALEKDVSYSNIELPVKTKSGDLRVGSFYGQLINIGNETYLFQTINDITERKEAEEELKYSEEKYSKAFLSSPDSISLSSMKEGIFVEINNGFEKIFGYSKEDALGKTTFELGLWQNIKDRDNCINILKEQGRVRNYIANYNAKDGRSGTGDISMELVVIRDEEYLLTTVRDITERIKIERELKASEEKFSTAFYASPDANAISRMKDGKIIDVNPVFEKLFEYTREEAIGKTTAELNLYSNPMDRNKVFDLLNKDGFARNLTIEYKAKSSKSGFLQISIDQINIADELCLITSIRDITDQIKTQRELEDYQQKLKSLTNEITLAEERERRRIAINLHDHLSQSLAMSKIRLAEAEKQKSEEGVYTKIRDAKNFLDNAITKSRSITYELSPPVLYDLGFSAAIRWQLDEVMKEHTIKTELKDTADKILLNDEVRVLLFRAVVEIINNALKHASASKLVVDISNDDEQLLVSVTDNGKGFDLNEAEQNAAKKRSFGIFSIRERISYIKGTMVIESKLNKGTSVKISIPYKNLDK